MLNNLSGVTELSGGHLGFSTFLGPSSRWNYQANWGVWGKAPELTTNTCFVSKVEKDCTCHVDDCWWCAKEHRSWNTKKAENPRINAFQLWCWKRLLRVPWTARRSNQLILKEINPEYSLEGLMPNLKLQYFSHLMWSAVSLEKTLMLGKIEGRSRRGR